MQEMIRATDPVPPLDSRLEPRPDASPSSPHARLEKTVEDGAPKARAEPEPNLRLSIDKAEDGLFYVYTIKDRETGRIISQTPRDELARVKDQPGYVAGTVVNTKA